MMPIMNGREFMAAIKRDNLLAPLPVVIVSATHDSATHDQSLSPVAQAQGFIKKPIDWDVLMSFVKKYC
jgi:CheY-like chemotaxis protein